MDICWPINSTSDTEAPPTCSSQLLLRGATNQKKADSQEFKLLIWDMFPDLWHLVSKHLRKVQSHRGCHGDTVHLLYTVYVHNHVALKHHHFNIFLLLCLLELFRKHHVNKTWFSQTSCDLERLPNTMIENIAKISLEKGENLLFIWRELMRSKQRGNVLSFSLATAAAFFGFSI